MTWIMQHLKKEQWNNYDQAKVRKPGEGGENVPPVSPAF